MQLRDIKASWVSPLKDKDDGSVPILLRQRRKGEAGNWAAEKASFQRSGKEHTI